MQSGIDYSKRKGRRTSALKERNPEQVNDPQRSRHRRSTIIDIKGQNVNNVFIYGYSGI